jgi:hypothetical protein
MLSTLRSGLAGAFGVLVIATGAVAQDQKSAGAPTPNGRGKLITNADLKSWNSIRQSALSFDGKWFAYVVGPTEGDEMLVVRGTAQGAKETRIPVGENGGPSPSRETRGGWASSSHRRGLRPVVAVVHRPHAAVERAGVKARRTRAAAKVAAMPDAARVHPLRIRRARAPTSTSSFC